MHLKIKDSTILRILTKWVEELWKKFTTPNYYSHKMEEVQLQNP